MRASREIARLFSFEGLLPTARAATARMAGSAGRRTRAGTAGQMGHGAGRGPRLRAIPAAHEERGRMPKANKKVVAPASCRECVNWPKVSERIRISEVLRKATTKMEEEIGGPAFKPSMAEYLKLVQLDKELESEEVKEIRVTWVEPEKTDESSSEA